MRFDRRLAFAFVALPLACASIETPPGEDDGSGASSSSGGKTATGGSKSGGASGTGGKASGGTTNSGGANATGGSKSGGASGAGGSSSGGANAGGSVAAGGSAASGGGASTGGQAATGGTGSGGAWAGDCEDKPTMAEWRGGTSQMTGDLVVHKCTKKQATCQNLELGVDSLFECSDSHANNCKTQFPEDGSAWTFRGECADLVPMGGASGMAGSGP